MLQLPLPLKIGLTMSFFFMGWGLKGFIIAEFLAAFLALILLIILIKKTLPLLKRFLAFLRSSKSQKLKFEYYLLVS